MHVIPNIGEVLPYLLEKRQGILKRHNFAKEKFGNQFNDEDNGRKEQQPERFDKPSFVP